jgi:hypothetical protein
MRVVNGRRIVQVIASFACMACESVAGLDDLEGRESRAPVADGTEWALRFGNSADQAATAVAVDGDGNVIVAGSFAGILDFGSGPLTSVQAQDVFVAKLSPTGEALWSRSFPCNHSRVTGVAVDSIGEILVAGYSEGKLELGLGDLDDGDGDAPFVFKLGVDGAVRWGRGWGVGGHQDALALAVSSDRRVLVGGSFFGAIRFEEERGTQELYSAGDRDAYVARLTPQGELDALAHIAGEHLQQVRALAVDGDHVIAAGTADATSTLGDVTLASHGSADLFVARLDADLSPIWSATFGNEEPNCLPACEVTLAVDDEHGVLFAGAYTGTADLGGGPLAAEFASDLLVGRFERYGVSGAPDHDWSARFGDAREQRPYGAVVVNGAELVLAGLFDGTMELGATTLTNGEDAVKDVFLLRFGRDGAALAARAFRNTDDVPDLDGRETSRGPALAAHPDGSVVVAGSFRGSIEVGARKLVAEGDAPNYDVFVTKLAP